MLNRTRKSSRWFKTIAWVFVVVLVVFAINFAFALKRVHDRQLAYKQAMFDHTVMQEVLCKFIEAEGRWPASWEEMAAELRGPIKGVGINREGMSWPDDRLVFEDKFAIDFSLSLNRVDDAFVAGEPSRVISASPELIKAYGVEQFRGLAQCVEQAISPRITDYDETNDGEIGTSTNRKTQPPSTEIQSVSFDYYAKNSTKMYIDECQAISGFLQDAIDRASLIDGPVGEATGIRVTANYVRGSIEMKIYGTMPITLVMKDKSDVLSSEDSAVLKQHLAELGF